MQTYFDIKKLEQTESSIAVMTDFIKKYECLLPQAISDVVDISTYARKLNSLGECWLLMKDDEVAGFVGGYINNFESKRAYLQLLLVSDNYQNMRGGRTLIECFLNYAREIDFKEVQLTVDVCNIKALHLYTKIGFVKSDEVHPNPKKQYMILKI